jgi:hypothetical protein
MTIELMQTIRTMDTETLRRIVELPEQAAGILGLNPQCDDACGICDDCSLISEARQYARQELEIPTEMTNTIN